VSHVATDSRPALRPYDATVANTGGSRLTFLDFLRGVVVVLMAIDHVRVYAGVPAGGPSPGVFFTRWITNFVAPWFVFLAGTAAYLYGQRVRDRGALSRFLLTRGLWLVFLELTVIRVAWTFNFDFQHYMLAGVIWMIGWCMVLMAGAVYLPLKAIATVGLIIIAGHNVLPGGAPLGAIGQFLYFGGAVQLGANGPPLLILYVLIPWIGVMMAGYALGAVMQLPAERRDAICLRIGVAAVIAFVVLRAVGVYGDPRAWKPAMGVLGFLNTAKYPASLQFLLMTLGPMFLLLPYAERARGRVADALVTFGRVPFFYYLLHIPTIHLAACVVSLIREGSVNPWLFGNHPLDPGPVPPGYRWSLGLLYLVWAVVIAVLYVACRWYAGYKAAHRSRWLSYL
jgi:uncharacterized membrane protein